MDATLLAGLAGLLGLMLGRFWDYRSEAARWRLFTATPDDDDATAAMTTNCGQLPTPNSVIGAATLTSASHRAAREVPESGRWQADPHRRRAAPRSGSGAAALPGVTTYGQPRSYGLRQVDAEAATMPTKPAEPSAPSMTPSSLPSAAVNRRRDQRIRIYEQIGSAYYATREAIRTMALLEHGTDKAAEAAFRALDVGAEFSRAIVAVWLHGSAPVATAVREINRELVKLFLTARAQQLSYEEWRVTRGPAEQALERFVEAVRAELALPQLTVAIRITDLGTPSESEQR